MLFITYCSVVSELTEKRYRNLLQVKENLCFRKDKLNHSRVNKKIKERARSTVKLVDHSKLRELVIVIRAASEDPV